MELLEVNHLCKTYGSGETAVHALKDVSFSVPKGEYVGTISVLVAERTDKEAFKAVKSLIDFLVLRQRPPRRDNYSSIDILTRYNVDFYLVEE